MGSEVLVDLASNEAERERHAGSETMTLANHA